MLDDNYITKIILFNCTFDEQVHLIIPFMLMILLNNVDIKALMISLLRAHTDKVLVGCMFELLRPITEYEVHHAGLSFYRHRGLLVVILHTLRSQVQQRILHRCTLEERDLGDPNSQTNVQ